MGLKLNQRATVFGMTFAALVLAACTAGADWSPADLGSSLALWLDAQDATTLTVDGGGAVSQWNDKSSYGNHVLQAATEKQPLLNTTGINGRQSIAFAGTGNFMMCTATAGLPTGNSDYSLVVVYRYDSSLVGTITSYAYPLSFGTAAATSMTAVDIKRNGGRFVHYNADQNMPAPQPTFLDGDAHYYVDVYDSTTLLEQLYFDGAVGPAVTQANPLTLGTNYIAINTFSNTNNNHGSLFQIGEVMIVSSKLSETDLQNLNSYLDARWSAQQLQAGDANGDGMVNLADLQILGDNWQSTTATWAEADFTGDGMVNLADLQILGDNWGIGVGSDLSFDQALSQVGAAVPEPASLSLIGLMGLMLFRRR